MKKYIVILICLIICIIISVTFAYKKYNVNVQDIKKFNEDFLQYQNRDIAGTEIGTLINKAIDNNEKYNIKKDTNGNYIFEEENCIRVDIYISENDKTYSMEDIYKLGITKFISSFSLENFKYTKVEYNKNTKKINYLLIEQQK